MADNSQKFIGRNRAPRVQIEYDVEHYGAKTKVQLPFVMGVLADLSGKLQTDKDGNPMPLPPVSERKMLEIDVDNFDDRLKAMKPRVSFAVPNRIPESLEPDSPIPKGELAVDITFTGMDDFSPDAIIGKVKALSDLLEKRKKLDTLITYMDGRDGAEDLLANALENPALLKDYLSGAEPAADAGEE